MVDILPSLRTLCSEGEFRLEHHWAEKVSQAKDQQEANHVLESFPYHANYVALTQMELSALFSACPAMHPRKFAIIGSGPLPLTSLCILSALHESPHAVMGIAEGPQETKAPVEVWNVDRDKQAVDMGSKVCDAVLRASMISHQVEKVEDTICDQAGLVKTLCAEAADLKIDLKSLDVVYLAALVGQDGREKLDILRSVVSQMKDGAAVMMRTAHSLRKVLYPVSTPLGKPS